MERVELKPNLLKNWKVEHYTLKVGANTRRTIDEHTRHIYP
jgi:hypothetical protein